MGKALSGELSCPCDRSCWKYIKSCCYHLGIIIQSRLDGLLKGFYVMGKALSDKTVYMQTDLVFLGLLLLELFPCV